MSWYSGFLTEPPKYRPVAVVDIGSNSIRLVVYDALSRVPVPILNEKVMCGLGRGLGQSGPLNPEARTLALANLARFKVLIDAATFLVVALLGATLKNERPRGLQHVSGQASVRGFRSIFSQPVLLASIIMLAAFNMSAGVNEVLGVFLVTDLLDGSASQYGLIMSSLGASMVVSGYILSRVEVRRPDTQMIVLSALTSAIGMLAYGLSPSIWFAALAFAVNGAGLTGLHTFATPLIVRHTSEDERGRVFAASASVTTGGTLVSTGIAGSIGQLLPVRVAIT